MSNKGVVLQLLSITTLGALGGGLAGLTACAGVDEREAVAELAVAPVDRALASVERASGASVRIERSETGATRVLAMAPGHAVATGIADPVAAAQRFVAEHHDALGLAASDGASFVATRADVDPTTDLRHITLQRMYAPAAGADGIPVFHGAVTVHLDAKNAVFEVLGDERYRIGPPVNRQVLTPADAVVAAVKALGAGALGPVAVGDRGADRGVADALRVTFTASGALAPIDVEPRIFQVAPGDDRFAYQVRLGWRDARRAEHTAIAVVDAEDGARLYDASLDSSFSTKAFLSSPGAAPTTDTRLAVPLAGTLTASPAGWVDTVRRTTAGNNAEAATDLNADNIIGPLEIQPVADAIEIFDFPFSPLVNASSFKEASVLDAFYLVNDFHDRTYALGFTEASGNCQKNNFGRGGVQNDEVLIDTQDGAGLNNAFFTTSPDGVKPRITLFLFNLAGGVQRDSAFDPSAVYHEATHALSSRIVGGGGASCLAGLQSGGMAEGWSDFVAASFLNEPVIGAYLSGNATVGIRSASMAASPFVYDDIQTGAIDEVHGVGEIWAAALWDARVALGGAVVERLVVNGMKLTPCSPTMLQARDGILSADAVLNGGANQCALRTAFANRGMGTGASSPNHNSTTAIITSTSVPSTCGGVGTIRTQRSVSTPLAIPDNSALGTNAVIAVATKSLTVQQVKVDVNISHPFRGDLIVQVVAPNGQTATLSNRAGGSADNFIVTGQNITSSFTTGSPATGTWRLFVRDLASGNVGTIHSFRLSITSP